MFTDKEITEYRNLCAALNELQEKYRRRKLELRQILEKTAEIRNNTLLVLVKANRLTRHLTARQRQISGLTYRLEEIKMRINRLSPAAQDMGEGDEAKYLSGFRDWQAEEKGGNLRDLKQKGLLILSLIDGLRKKLLQFDLLELRCRELALSISKALEAFRHESNNIRRKIYPFGIFSHFGRKFRGLWGSAYFTLRDMDDITALGNITGHVLKIADSPIM